MKALFFGGAFNPMTNAHLHLAKEVKEAFGFEKVLFVPTKSKYILGTEAKDFSFTEKERYEMLLHVASSHSFMAVSDIEIQEKDQPRTYLTMKKLKEEGYDLTLMIGSDWLKDLKTKWMYIDEILDEFSLLIIRRNHDDIENILDSDPYLKERKEKFMIYDPKGNYQNISSSEVRRLMKNFHENEEKIKELVPIEVFEDIRRIER